MMRKPLTILCFILITFVYSCSVNSPYRRQLANTQDVSPGPCIRHLDKIVSLEKTPREVEDAYVVCLSDYIKIKTIAPQGHEHLATAFFKKIFDAQDIPSKEFVVPELDEKLRPKPNKERYNLVATVSKNLSSTFDWSKKNPDSIILLNHTDVVDARPSQWIQPELAFSGNKRRDKSGKGEEFIWGRGALDMKSVGITQLINMVLLKKSGQKLQRDVHFLAVADEEHGAAGAIGALRKMKKGEELYALNKASLLLNEGGGGVQNIVKENNHLFLISTEEKGGAWFKMSAPTLKELIKAINVTGVFDSRMLFKSRTRKVRYDCLLYSIETPDRKVNVVSSHLILDLKCPALGKTAIVNLFKKPFPEASIKLSRHKGDRYLVDITSASSSHGSLGANLSALDIALLGLHRLRLIKLKEKFVAPRYLRYIKSDATKLMIKNIAKTQRALGLLNKLSFVGFINKIMLQVLEQSFDSDGLFRTTCNLTALDVSYGKAEALVDCRLLHPLKSYQHLDNHALRFVQDLKKRVNNDNVKFDLINGWNVSSSPVHTQDYQLIDQTLTSFSDRQNLISVVPFIFPGGSDSTWFRNPHTAGAPDVEPIPSYGFFPLYLTADLLKTVHGSNERLPVKEIGPTVQRYFKVLSSLAERSP